ncbi:MAG TPA: hypothetical protein VNN77_08070 [candidate division Zixibacteria bacterium]|nr:hypothetical protein [candidate division Zixibacteria bacterium]
MSEENEIAWLKLSDGSDLVLTRLHVIHRRDRGVLGESRSIVPRSAISRVRIAWRRSLGLAALGAASAAVYLFMLVGGGLGGISGIFPEPGATLDLAVQYGSLVAAAAFLASFWFYKPMEIEIAAGTATITGTPKSYEEAQEFSARLTAESEPGERTGEREAEAPAQRTGRESEWEL